MNSKECIFDITEDQFNEKVLEQSVNNLIMVDFWAPWCGPCKQLTPLLEKIIIKLKGAVHLVKINIDENQQIAGQLNIQSIPAVFAFKNKKVVDAFQGVIPEQKIIAFIEKHIDSKIEKDHSDFHNIIKNFFIEKKFDDAKNLIEDHFAENSDDLKSISLYIDCLAAMLSFEDAEEFIKSVSSEVLKDELIKASILKLELKKVNSAGPSLDILKKLYEENPKNIKNITSLADKLFSDDQIDDAFDLLFENYKIDNKSIKKKLLEFFEAMGNTDPKTIINRRKLSSLIFS